MQLKSKGTAYICWILFGVHYAYLGKWGTQFLYWITLGGFGVWAIIDLFTISGKVNRYNNAIVHEFEPVEDEDDYDYLTNLEILAEASNKEELTEERSILDKKEPEEKNLEYNYKVFFTYKQSFPGVNKGKNVKVKKDNIKIAFEHEPSDFDIKTKVKDYINSMEKFMSDIDVKLEFDGIVKVQRLKVVKGRKDIAGDLDKLSDI